MSAAPRESRWAEQQKPQKHGRRRGKHGKLSGVFSSGAGWVTHTLELSSAQVQNPKGLLLSR